MLELDKCWTEQPAVVAIDFETCSLHVEDGAVEVAALRFEQGILTAKYMTFLNPGRDVPPEATAIHNITNNMVCGAPRLQDVAGELLKVCRDAVPLAYNAVFDRGFLHASITGKDCPAFDPEFAWVDPMVIVKDVDKHERGAGKNKLTSACARWGVEMEHAHRAACDASAAAALFFALANKGKIPKMPLGKLLSRIETRRKAQDADFQAYLDRQKTKEAANG